MEVHILGLRSGNRADAEQKASDRCNQSDQGDQVPICSRNQDVVQRARRDQTYTNSRIRRLMSASRPKPQRTGKYLKLNNNFVLDHYAVARSKSQRLRELVLEIRSLRS